MHGVASVPPRLRPLSLLLPFMTTSGYIAHNYINTTNIHSPSFPIQADTKV